MKINYSKLKGCQLVLFGGESIFPKLWRFIKTGFREWEDHTKITSVGIVYEMGIT